jgi:hypothetical protein
MLMMFDYETDTNPYFTFTSPSYLSGVTRNTPSSITLAWSSPSLDTSYTIYLTRKNRDSSDSVVVATKTFIDSCSQKVIILVNTSRIHSPYLDINLIAPFVTGTIGVANTSVTLGKFQVLFCVSCV